MEQWNNYRIPGIFFICLSTNAYKYQYIHNENNVVRVKHEEKEQFKATFKTLSLKNHHGFFNTVSK